MPVPVAVIYRETLSPFLLAAAASAAFRWMLERVTTGKQWITPREGFFASSSSRSPCS